MLSQSFAYNTWSASVKYTYSSSKPSSWISLTVLAGRNTGSMLGICITLTSGLSPKPFTVS